MEWIGFDLDGTLANDSGKNSISDIGAPVPEVVQQLHMHLAQGDRVKIFTARVAAGDRENSWDPTESRLHIQKWCKEHLGVVLEVTSEKDQHLRLFYDDRAVHVTRNKGTIHMTMDLMLELIRPLVRAKEAKA